MPEDHAPEEIKTLILLAKQYTPGGKLVDAFYPASNAAYHVAARMAKQISETWDVSAYQLNMLRIKPICARLPYFGKGKNTLNYLPQIGSRFCMELLGLNVLVNQEEEKARYPERQLPCAVCGKCMQACPNGAITEQGFIKERCIRFHMLNGKAMPEALRQYIGAENGTMGIVGCDICQRVCPANAEIEKTRTDADAFPLRDLLICNPETMKRFALLYGKNYAIRNRILAQAVLAALHAEQAELLPSISALCSSASPVVAEHAAWVAEKMKNKKIY